MAEMGHLMAPTLLLAVAAVVVLVQLVRQAHYHRLLLEAAATEPRRLSLAEALLTLVAVAAVALKLRQAQAEMAALAVAARDRILPLVPLARLTPVVAVAAADIQAPVYLTAAQAVPVSFLSSTTSALPRSSPSSPRRSGSHLLGR